MIQSISHCHAQALYLSLTTKVMTHTASAGNSTLLVVVTIFTCVQPTKNTQKIHTQFLFFFFFGFGFLRIPGVFFFYFFSITF